MKNVPLQRPLHAMPTVILLSQVRAGPADDAVKLNASSDVEVMYPCSFLIQFTRRRQEYVALVKKKSLEKYTSSRSNSCIFFPFIIYFFTSNFCSISANTVMHMERQW